MAARQASASALALGDDNREARAKKLQDLMARKYPHAGHADDGCTQIGGAKTRAKSMMHWPASRRRHAVRRDRSHVMEVKLEQSKPPGPGDFRRGAPSYPAYARRGKPKLIIL